jgi:YD repeat-containing protein
MYTEVRSIDSANGYTDQYFSYYPDIPPSPGSFPAVPLTDYSGYRGSLLQERTFDKNNTLLKKTINSYGNWGTESQIGVKAKGYWRAEFTEPYAWREYPLSTELPSMSACNSYSVFQNSTLLIQSIDSVYSPAGTQTLRTDYTYYNNGTAFLKQKISYINGNKSKEQTYKYAFNSTSDFNLGLTTGESTMKSTLQNKYFMSPLEVVDSIRTNGNNPSFSSGAKFIFATFNTDKIHLTKYKAYTTASDSSEINFSAYDHNGNLTEQYKTNDINEVNLWGYNGQYLVAKITGSDYVTVAGLVNQSILTNPSSDAALRTELNKIRNGLAGTMAQVVTYTYSPLYGMTSMTDATGRTTYYEYDLFGRLKLVRDQDNRIVKKIEYKFNNPE